jgi:hypothetical protein
VNSILSAYSGSTSEAISYPACGGQSSCGGVSYSSSVAQGIQAVASAVNSYNSQCPQTKLVLVGYSQVSDESHHSNHKCSFLTWLNASQRGVRLWTQRCAVAVSLTRGTLTLRFHWHLPLSIWSRRPFSWVTLSSKPDCHMMLEHALQEV